MDKLKQSRYAVKRSLQRGGRRALSGGGTRSPRSCGGRDGMVGVPEQPPLLCDCSLIPFVHYIEQCASERLHNTEGALAHVQFPTEPPLL